MEDLAIIGAGPAGLAAAVAAQRLKPVVLESGSHHDQRTQADQTDVVAGVGGAGLFSDGKFSFWPSATALWQLRHEALTEAYKWFTTELTRVGIVPPPLVSLRDNDLPRQTREKRYPSINSSLDARMRLIRQLATQAERIRTSTSVIGIRDLGNAWLVELADEEPVVARRIIVATGRLGPGLIAKSIGSCSMQLLRVEAGVRIEQPAERFFLKEHPQVDPKYIWRQGDGLTEWRTFCCCRQGLVVPTRFQGLLSVSGRADCPPTGRSNVGFNVRIVDHFTALRAWSHLRSCASTIHAPAQQVLKDYLECFGKRSSPLTKILGAELSERLAVGLRLLLRHFPSHDLTEAMLVGPAIEGVGYYPKHDDLLATSARALWVAGDVAGTFRGLTAALISGHIAGQAAVFGTGRAQQ